MEEGVAVSQHFVDVDGEVHEVPRGLKVGSGDQPGCQVVSWTSTGDVRLSSTAYSRPH